MVDLRQRRPEADVAARSSAKDTGNFSAPLYPEDVVPQLAALLLAEDLVAVLLFEPRQVNIRVEGDAGYGILPGVHSDLQVCVDRG